MPIEITSCSEKMSTIYTQRQHFHSTPDWGEVVKKFLWYQEKQRPWRGVEGILPQTRLGHKACIHANEDTHTRPQRLAERSFLLADFLSSRELLAVWGTFLILWPLQHLAHRAAFSFSFSVMEVSSSSSPSENILPTFAATNSEKHLTHGHKSKHGLPTL